MNKDSRGRLEGKIAIITGGTSGIGAATVDAFLAQGAKVMVSDISDRPENLPISNCHFLKADVSNPEDTTHLVNETVKQFGRVDILVNSAGIGDLCPSHEVTFESWRRTMSVNLDGSFLITQAAIRQMLLQKEGGSIVNVASIHGHVGFAAHAAYTASKGAVINLTRSLGIEYAQQSIRVNSVCPGFVWTPMIEKGVPSEMMAAIEELHPMGRIAQASEIALPIVFLASDEASFITGSNLIVDGGYLAQ